MIENRNRFTTLSIDSYEDRVPVGTIINPFLSEPINFYGTMDMIVKIQDLIERMNFPKPHTLIRKFGDTILEPDRFECISKPSKMATFTLQIMFCQNSSWQGVLKWNDTQKTECFRSTLELLLLLNSALESYINVNEKISIDEGMQ